MLWLIDELESIVETDAVAFELEVGLGTGAFIGRIRFPTTIRLPGLEQPIDMLLLPR
jgi:hypothetical protein